MLDYVYKQHDPAVLWTAHRWEYTDRNISNQMKLQKGMTVYQHPWVSSHMKTFRAKNLKDVPMSNFFDDENNWIMIACDQAVFLPMMHKSINEGKNLIFFPRVCYHYSINLQDPALFTCDRSINQKQSAEFIRNRGYLTQ